MLLFRQGNWGWNAIQRQREAALAKKNGETPDLSQPMGRGQPLPPPGTPLPGPNGKVIPPKRKPVGDSSLPPGSPHADETTFSRRRSSTAATAESGETSSHERLPIPQRRRRGEDHDSSGHDDMGMLVVAAPEDESLPNSPANEREEYIGEMDVVGELAVKNQLTPPRSKSSSGFSSGDEGTDPVKHQSNEALPPPKISPPLPISASQSPLMAVPAVHTPEEEEDDDLSGWLENETEEEEEREEEEEGEEGEEEEQLSFPATQTGAKPIIERKPVGTVQDAIATKGEKTENETDAQQAARLAMMH